MATVAKNPLNLGDTTYFALVLQTVFAIPCNTFFTGLYPD